MNKNPENPSNESESNVQSGITRRSFIKRTTSTTLGIALATAAFRSEAIAAESGGSSGVYRLELLPSGCPALNIVFTDSSGYQEVVVGDIDRTQSATYGGYSWTSFSRMRVTPNSFHSDPVPDGTYHFLNPLSFDVVVTVTLTVVEIATGQTIGTNTFERSGSLGATLVDSIHGYVQGSASADDTSVIFATAHVGGNDYRVVVSATAVDNTPDPIGTSVSPIFGMSLSVYTLVPGSPTNDLVLNASNANSFTWSSFWKPQ